MFVEVLDFNKVVLRSETATPKANSYAIKVYFFAYLCAGKMCDSRIVCLFVGGAPLA